MKRKAIGRLTATLAAATLAGAITVVQAPAAQACSCAARDTGRALAGADGAFVGILTQRDDPHRDAEVVSSMRPVVHHFEVEQAVKGELDDRIQVVSAASGASCGIEASIGDRVGLLLERDGDRWVSSLCYQVVAQRLLAAAETQRPVESAGPTAVVAGGRHGSARLVALDASGQVVALGRGDGYATLVSICPGGERLVELFTVTAPENEGAPRQVPHVAVREVHDLDVVTQQRLAGLFRTNENQRNIRSLSCRSRLADDTLLFVEEQAAGAQRGRIIRVGPDGQASLWEGRGTTASFADDEDVAYVTVRLRSGGDELRIVDLGTGEEQPVAVFDAWTGPFAAGPGGDAVAAVVYSSPTGTNDPPSQVVSVDLTTEPPTTRATPLGQTNVAGEVVWLSHDRLAFVPTTGDADSVRLLDASLDEVVAWKGWSGAHDVARSGDRLVASGRGGVHCLDPTTGTVAEFASLDSLDLPEDDPPAAGDVDLGGPDLFSVAVVDPEREVEHCDSRELERVGGTDSKAAPDAETVAPATQPIGSSPGSGLTEGLIAAVLTPATVGLVLHWQRRRIRSLTHRGGIANSP